MADDGGSQGQSSDSESGGEEASSSSTGSGSNPTSTSSESASGGGGGVSTTTLAVAVAVPIVVLLLVFGVVIWLGMRKGWFVRKNAQDPRSGAAAEKGDGFTQSGSGKANGDHGEPAVLSVRELHANDLPHQLESSPVHELQGGEGGQHYVVRN